MPGHSESFSRMGRSASGKMPFVRIGTSMPIGVPLVSQSSRMSASGSPAARRMALKRSTCTVERLPLRRA
eukprot:5713161-Heterocapsa_arctica.AAC.1